MLKDLSKDTLLQYHDKYLENEEYDKSYKLYREQFVELKSRIKIWSNIDAEDFRLTALGFANAWKSRTKSSPDVAQKVVDRFKKIEKEFAYFENKDIRDIDLDEDKSKIIDIYECFEDVNPTARGKILHMMNEKIFPIWDASIREMYGVFGNAQGFHTFMILIQRQLNQLGNNNIKEIENISKVPILKILDEYNWYINSRD